MPSKHTNTYSLIAAAAVLAACGNTYAATSGLVLSHDSVAGSILISHKDRSVNLKPVVPASSLQCGHLLCEYMTEPRGVQTTLPRLSWQLATDQRAVVQTAYRILVSDSPAKLSSGVGIIWDSGKVKSSQSVGVGYHGPTLSSGKVYFWKVQVWDQVGAPSQFSAPSMWQMGLLNDSDWKARWISAETPVNQEIDGNNLTPPPYLRHDFTLAKAIRHATAYVTARGIYELHLNGAKVGQDLLTPGWTDYTKHIDYQTYDITGSLHHGANAVGAILADGWYAGYYGFGHQRNLYGGRPSFLMQIDVEFTDRTHQIVSTDSSWRSTTGAFTYGDLLQGESFDSQHELHGWDQPGFHSSDWLPVTLASLNAPLHEVDITTQVKSMVKDNTLSVAASNDLGGDPAYNSVKQMRVDYTLDGVPHSQTVAEHESVNVPGPGEAGGKLVVVRARYGILDQANSHPLLVGAQGPPVRITQYMPTKSISMPAPGTWIFDLGQNMVGWVQLRVKAPAGTKIKMRFGEVLNPDGSLYTTNLRSAHATDTYICNGQGDELWQPRFTFHGFRYVELTGYSGTPVPQMITGCVVGSDTPPTGTFSCSSPLVNQIMKNVVWGQRGNFLSVPTDCPQRDERLGWMGDAQIFARTATFNRDVSSFYEKWITDVEDAQSGQGAYSDVSPRMVDQSDGAPAWGDCGVIVPWTVWQAYGDTGLVSRHWASMVRWMDYVTSVNPNGLWLQRRNNDFGDWLAIGADTPKEVLATAYYAHDAALMAQMAAAIGRTDDAQKYQALFEHIKSAFNAAYVSSDGTVHGDTQTCYLVALRFNLLPDNLKPLAAQHLAAAIHAKNDHLSTGFVGVGYLCPTLSANGLNDLAYKLLLTDTFPSWGFSVRQGATTIWERWDGYTPDKGFQDPGMNSFNHYSLGSVGEWLYRDVAGIDTDPNQPGFAHILMHPHPGPGLTSVTSSYDSMHGKIVSEWSTQGSTFTWHVVVPANTTATIWIPTSDPSTIKEGDRPAASTSGLSQVRTEPGFAVYEIASGSYAFTAAQ